METNLLEIISNFKRKKIVLFGDLVLDQFLYGEISRISREAPVLILDHEKTVELLGGGANALHNVWSLGGEVFPVGIVGDDEAGAKLLELLRQKKIEISGIFKVKGYVTPTKTRILAGSAHSSKQQIVRIDRGTKCTLDELIVKQILKKLELLLSDDPDSIIVSDYGYQLNRDEIISLLKKNSKKDNIPLVVDSRFDLPRYTSVSSITPNISEIEEALHVKIGNDLPLLESVGKRLLSEQDLGSLLITRGRHGMSLFEPQKKPFHLPVFGSDEVADVTGAGDTVVASFALGLAAGATFYQAAKLANFAGGIVVMKRGTATVSAAELQDVVESG